MNKCINVPDGCEDPAELFCDVCKIAGICQRCWWDCLYSDHGNAWTVFVRENLCYECAKKGKVPSSSEPLHKS